MATGNDSTNEAISLSREDLPNLCFVASSPFVVTAFLRDHFVALSKRYRITVISDLKASTYVLDVPEYVTVHHVPIQREIALFRDAAALFTLIRLFTVNRFDAVHSITPKGGLLAMIAAFVTRVPKRIHVFTGQVWATQHGSKRVLLKATDKLLSWCATSLLADSPSQRQFLIDEGIVNADRITVLADGSMVGVDLERFQQNAAVRQSIRAELDISPTAIVILFVGRLKREKGVPDLLAAWHNIRDTHPAAHLVLVGPDEEELLDKLPNDERLHAVGYTLQVERYMAAADILVLPSYREGFGSVLLEAAATRLPVVASRIYGITDAVVEGKTGLLHRPGDVPDLGEKLLQLLTDESLRLRLGNAGFESVSKSFTQERVTQAMLVFYDELFETD
jgi:glycosyltransferase involved in cell wall biosynthesis